MPIRVLHIVTQMNRAGLESRIMDIYRNIDRNVIQFDFYSCSQEKGVFDDEIEALGGIVYYGKKLSFSGTLRISDQFFAFLSDHPEYRIVHCHMNQWCGLILKGAYMAGVPHRIAHSRTSLETVTLKNVIKNTIKIPTVKYANHYFAVSKKAGIWLFGKKLVQSGKVEILPNAINCSLFQYNEQRRIEIRKKLNLSSQFVLINVGNLRFEKNQKFLLEVLAKIPSSVDNIKLLFVGGDSGLKNKLVEKANSLGVKDKVVFLGSRTDVADLLFAADVFVFPSLYEGFPGAVLEAEASGIPCLISERITYEVCINDNAFVLPITNAEIWKDKVLQLYVQQSDYPEMNRARNVKVDIMNYDIHRLIDILSKKYISYNMGY